MSQSNKQGGWTQALARAAEAGDAALVGELLAAGAPADVRLEGGATPLMRAAARGFEDVARALLDAGADVNARRGDGFTPLVLAVFFGHERVVRLLLERGADPSARTRLGVSAQDWAASRGFDAVNELLLHPPAPSAPPARQPAAPRVPVTVTVSRQVGEAEIIESILPKRVREVEVEREEPARPRQANSAEPQFYTPPPRPGWSWQMSAGVFLLVTAGGLGAFALWQRSQGPAGPQRITPPAPAAGPAQASQPLPTPAAQTSPTPDAQAGAPTPLMPGAIIIPAAPPTQPAPLPPDAYGPAGAAPAVVSENAAAPTPEGPAPRREPREPAAPDTPAVVRDEQRRPEDNDARRERTPEPAIRTQPPPADPQPTPRRRVIQWPP